MNGGAPEQRLLKSVHDSLTYWQKQQEEPSPRVARVVMNLEEEIQRGPDNVVDFWRFYPSSNFDPCPCAGHKSRPDKEIEKSNRDALTRAGVLLDFVARATHGEQELDWYHIEKLTAAMQIILEQMQRRST